MNWYKVHTLTVSNLKVANYMIDHECEMTGIEAIPEAISNVGMIFKSENVQEVYGHAIKKELPALTYNETNRLRSMLALLICVKRQELAEAGGVL